MWILLALQLSAGGVFYTWTNLGTFDTKTNCEVTAAHIMTVSTLTAGANGLKKAECARVK